jgi:5'-nucleotidase
MKRLSVMLLLLLSGCAARGAPEELATIDVSVLAINDFHGNLMPPAGGIAIADPSDPAKRIAVPAGGSEYLATLVHQLRAKTPNSIFVAAGDLIGGSPLLSALFHDEATVESLSLMGLEVSAVGNHEFDEGPHELRRIQNGGCHPKDGCKGPQAFTGAKYKYLAASTIDTATGVTILPPYHIKTFGGVPVAFIGLTTQNTPRVVIPSGVAGLEFRDEAETVNALVPELRARGIEAIVVLIHEGGTPTGDYNACPTISGRIVDIVPNLVKAVDVVISGHSHQAYNCVIDGRLVTSAHRYGTVVTEISLRIDAKTRDVVSAKAENVIARHEGAAKDAAQTRLLAGYADAAQPVANRVIGRITEALSNVTNPAGASTLGGVIADAMLSATTAADKGGAQIAFMNRGGIRTQIAMRPDGVVTYGDLFAVQPFGNFLVTLTLTGAQIKTLLELQWADPAAMQMLQVSEGFSYTWDAALPAGARVVPDSISLGGKPIDPTAAYRVTVNNFLADGGDGFVVLQDGADRLSGVEDIEAVEAYFRNNNPVSPRPLERIRRVN